MWRGIVHMFALLGLLFFLLGLGGYCWGEDLLEVLPAISSVEEGGG